MASFPGAGPVRRRTADRDHGHNEIAMPAQKRSSVAASLP
jgi:hypothetical protein